MICTLHIKNIGIIEEISIDFNKGLNVLTGETGAGKTLIIDSLQVISGGRFSKDMIRKGENNSFVEMCLYDPENESSIDGNIIVSREISLNGKNICKINGRMVTVNELKRFMSEYIEIHGQNDNHNLLDEKKQIDYLDGFIGEKIKKVKEEYESLYNRKLEIEKELKSNYGDDKEKQRELDILTYQVNEIEQANLKVEEETELENRREIIINSEKISSSIKEADELISENAIDSVSIAIRSLEKIENFNEKYEKISSSLKSTYYELQEIARDINDYKDEIEFDEEERNYVEERLDLIYSLKRKYGNTIEEILEYKDKILKEIKHIENLEEYNKKLKNERNIITEKMDLLGKNIHEVRLNNSIVLGDLINKELYDLEMKNAKVSIKVSYNNNEYFKSGKDSVEFFASTNKGEDEKELNKIASGGEASRIMLAIKKVLADSDKIPVLIFDEIDTGISGKAANCVAKKLYMISKKHQIMCISHLPNVAAIADYNYFISKDVKEGRTKTKIKLLKENEVIEEIARISSGEINEISIQYANELRNKKAS